MTAVKQGRIAIIAALAALGVLGPAGFGGDAASASRRGAEYFSNLPVVTHDGETVRFYDDLLKGKIVVINFIYTNCPDICSLSTARMAQVRDWLGERVGREIFIYSLTLDPEHDTPQALKKYATAFGAGNGWVFLTGKPDDIHAIRWKLGERSRTLNEHRSDMVLGNDTTGEWRRISLMGNLQIVTQRILEMDPEWRARERTVTAVALDKSRQDYVIKNRPGEALYLKACSYCHTFGNGDRVGPDLQGVTTRREHAWLVRYLVAPDVLRGMKDPVAVQLDAKYEGVSMPNLGLSDADAADIIAYLNDRTAQLRAEAAPDDPGASTEYEHDHLEHDHHEHNHDHHDHH